MPRARRGLRLRREGGQQLQLRRQRRGGHEEPYLGKNGHIAVKTNSIPRAAAELAKNGFTLDESTAKYKGEKMVAVYLKQEFGGFAVHLLQK